MKILVTGGAGFIGSAVVRQAIARGDSVVNLDALTYAGSLTNVASGGQALPVNLLNEMRATCPQAAIRRG